MNNATDDKIVKVGRQKMSNKSRLQKKYGSLFSSPYKKSDDVCTFQKLLSKLKQLFVNTIISRIFGA